MKLITKTIVVLFLLSNVLVQAQSEIKIQKSQIFKDKNTLSNLVFSVDDGKGGLFLLRRLSSTFGRNSRGYVLEHFDHDLKLLVSKEFEDQNNVFKALFINDNKINLIESIKNSKEKSLSYNLLSASIEDLNFSSKTIFSINKDDINNTFLADLGLFLTANYFKLDSDLLGEVQISKNNKYIAFNFDIKNDKKETHRILVYDINLNKIYQKEFSQNIKDKYFKYNSFKISEEDGSVFFLGKAYKNESYKDLKDGIINYNFKLYKLSNEGIQFETFSTNETFINSLELLINKNQVFCVGTYSDKSSYNDRGVVFYEVDTNNLKTKNFKLNPFTEQFLIDKYGEKKGKKKSQDKAELSNLVYKDFFITDQNEIYINAEEYFISSYPSTSSSGSTHYVTSYNFNDIFSFKLNFNGELQWMRTINKGQSTTGIFDYFSYSSLVYKGKMYIFLNGDEDVKKIKDNRISFKQTKIKKMNFYAIEIDEEGNFTYKILITDKDSKITYKPFFGIYTDEEGVILFEGNDGRDKQIIKLKI
ncbi:hypothetical protein GOQ30_10200 [Flavobacterium sp. TP390]|uniref:Uncharacterized protein n=1 Tax=Flavobacterium profundi TaxID=1774945 RepID=A0A6I4ILH7_9FLAO|nr:hypothetical protein [Flavobacterium profundi]MVO09529.1 hypothetical protein [Flavobacterium profundi]